MKLINILNKTLANGKLEWKIIKNNEEYFIHFIDSYYLNKLDSNVYKIYRQISSGLTRIIE